MPDATSVNALPNYVRRRDCTLMLTYQCNLNCVYCYETFKSDRRMSFETAQAIILKEFEFVKNSPDYDELQIDFMGGEPLIVFDLIRQIAEWVISEPRPVPFIMFLCTNGTLLTPEMKQWFRDHKRYVTAGISFDGTPDMQNLNRSHSADKADLEFFHEVFPDQPVKMTASCDSIQFFAEGVIYLHERAIPVAANCGYGMPWDEQTIAEYGHQLKILAEYYLEHPDVTPIKTFLPVFSNIIERYTPKKFCGAGTAMATYDYDGTLYPCHLFTPIVLGDKQAAYLQEQYDFNASQVHLDPRCADCCLCAVCPTCYGFNYKATGKIAIREDVMCELYKQQFQVAAWYFTEYMKRKKAAGKTLSYADLQEAKGILYFYNHPPKSLKECPSSVTEAERINP